MSSNELPPTPKGFSTRPGAVGDPPEHYGNPLAEQRALAEGVAIVDLSDRAILTVTGPDRLTWLDSLTSQSLGKLTPGQSAETLLLDPNGRIEHAIRVVDDGETAWLLVDAAQAGALVAWLERMRFMLRVEVADRTDSFTTVGTLGEPPLPAIVTWRDPWSELAAGGYQYAHVDAHPGAAWTYREVVVDSGADLSGFPAAGSLALEALRIAAWRPRLVTEGDDRSIPHELDWMRSAVHLAKGCYRGQETVAKVHNLGHPPRRLVMLHLDGSEGVLPGVGAPVQLGAAGVDAADAEPVTVGKVTSSALHHELGPIALAVIRRTTDPDADLTVVADDILIAAAQEVIVPPDAGAVAGVPRLPRLGAVVRR